MRLPRVRFTVRRMMIAVAIVTLLIWSSSIAMRWDDYRRKAARLEQEAIVHLSQVDRNKTRGVSPEWTASRQAVVAEEFRRAAKYRRAMWRPWLPVEPDPPEPK